MKGHSILGKNYILNSKYFPKTLIRPKNEIFVPFQTQTPFMECIHMALYGKTIDVVEDRESDFGSEKTIARIAAEYKIKINVYCITSIIGGREISFKKSYYSEGKLKTHY
jgi:hypothetical protein